MADIYSGAMIMLSICSLLWIVGLKATQHRSQRLGLLVAKLVVLLIVAYIVFLWDNAVLTAIIPYSNVILLGNFFPVGAAILSGIACGRLREFRYRQAATAIAMLAAGGVGLFWPLLGSPPECGDKWVNGACLQTTRSSCMAAASATLLQSHGVTASEKRMARLCFTREHGTNWLGLYHGLAVKLKSRGLRPALFDETLKQLRQHRDPQIISCELTEETAKAHPRLRDEWGWIVGVKHAVVLLEIDDQTVRVADPANGLEVWSLAQLQLLWDGRGARVESIPGYHDPDKPVTVSK
ncbi:MAG: hypothetical protein AB8G99_26890 [Planctomycetaceae bacterium]